jgi:hypothetical protein
MLRELAAICAVSDKPAADREMQIFCKYVCRQFANFLIGWDRSFQQTSRRILYSAESWCESSSNVVGEVGLASTLILLVLFQSATNLGALSSKENL